MAPGFFDKNEIDQFVSRQMETWQKGLEGKGAFRKWLAGQKEIHYITISRQTGSGGEEIARLLAEQMGWQLYDKEILDYMAENMKVHVKVLESVDEKTIGWIRDTIAPLFSTERTPHVEQMTYYKHLCHVLHILAQHGQAILVGRAAGLILPREKGLTVRIVAPFEVRCERYARQYGMSVEDARMIVAKTDANQAAFAREFVGKDLEDPEHYDLICNTERFSPESAAKIIWRAFAQRMVDEHIEKKHKDARIAALVEQQMKQWKDSRRDKPAVGASSARESEPRIGYICIGRQVGSAAEEVALRLSDLMDWQVYDRGILDYMAENMHVHVQLLETVDERTQSWIQKTLLPLFKTDSQSQVKETRYCEHLAAVLLVLAEHGKAILVGRGANQFLPREKGLSVFISASFEQRVKRYARGAGISEEEASTALTAVDKEQARFVKYFTGKDLLDMSHYDLALNTDKLAPVSIAKIIYRAMDQIDPSVSSSAS